MSGFKRYAIYYLPDDKNLARFGASWLGWDIVAGQFVPQLDIEHMNDVTETPRKYGFHGTLKPPFQLANGKKIAELASDLAVFAEQTAAIQLDGLQLSRIGHFLALIPEGDTTSLGELAFSIVEAFDSYRRPPQESELERRRAKGLSSAQEMNLRRWGYPYVGHEFRFHLTLTEQLADARLGQVAAQLKRVLPPLPSPLNVNSIALVGEEVSGRFRMIRRYALTG